MRVTKTNGQKEHFPRHKIHRIKITKESFNYHGRPRWWNKHIGEVFNAIRTRSNGGFSIYHITKDGFDRIGNGCISAIVYSPYCKTVKGKKK